jgi:acetyl-CoA carboxylase biotin carboxyl carrier protein
VAATQAVQSAAAPQPAAAPQAAAPASAESATPTAPAAKKPVEIKSPTPGTFYRSSSPDAEPFAKVGTKVKPDTIVCIIEAMKVFNEIPAEVSGTIVAVKAEDKQPVEYGQVLFHVEPD